MDQQGTQPVHMHYTYDTAHEAHRMHDFIAPHLKPGLMASPVAQDADGRWGFTVSGTTAPEPEHIRRHARTAKQHLLATIQALEALRPAAALAELDIAAALEAMDLEQSWDEIDPLGTLITKLQQLVKQGMDHGMFPEG